MAPVRKQRPPSGSTPPIGTLSIHEEQNNHGPEENWSNDSEEEVHGHGPEKNRNVPARRTPLDQVRPKMRSMASILARAKPVAKVRLEQDLNELPADVDSPSLQLAPAVVDQSMGTPTHEAAYPHELDGPRDLEGDTVMSETSDCSLEGRYIPSVKSSGRWRVAFRHTEESEVMSACHLVDMNCSLGSTIASNKSKILQAEVASPPPAASTLKTGRHFLPSSNSVNSEMDEDHGRDEDNGPDEDYEKDENHPLRQPEGSLVHSVYLQVLACGREGISIEELLSSFHNQSVSASLADDWEEDVADCLNHNRHFVQVQGNYLLRHFLDRPSKGKEIQKSGRFHQGERGMKVTRKDKGKRVQRDERLGKRAPNGRLFRDNEDEKTAKRVRGSLLAMHARITAEYGIQTGAARCALVTSLERKQPWQCPMTAMKGDKLCAYHHQKREDTKRAAKLNRKLVKLKR